MIVKGLERFFHNVHGQIKGTKAERFEPFVEAMETLFLSVNTRTAQGPHVRDALDLKRFMTIVIVSLMPCFFFGVYNTGVQILLAAGQAVTFSAAIMEGLYVVMPIVIVSYAVGGFWEVLFGVVRKHPINEGFFVSGFLFPIILPPTIPLWQVAVGVSFGVVIGKEVFGGTGMNILNPALLARCFLFFAYPGNMSGDNVWVETLTSSADAVTSATPLAVVVAGSGDSVVNVLSQAGFSFKNLFLGAHAGSIAETSTLAILLGAVVLLVTKVGSYRTMIAVFLGGFLTALLINSLAGKDASLYMQLPAHYHFVMGGFAFGAVFMATDPVSSTSTATGKWIYGFLIGMLAVVIRVFNPAYPEGMMLAILFMNLFAPLIDYYVIKSKKARRAARATK